MVQLSVISDKEGDVIVSPKPKSLVTFKVYAVCGQASSGYGSVQLADCIKNNVCSVGDVKMLTWSFMVSIVLSALGFEI